MTSCPHCAETVAALEREIRRLKALLVKAEKDAIARAGRAYTEGYGKGYLDAENESDHQRRMYGDDPT